MRDRASWLLSTAALTFALLGLPGPVAADEGKSPAPKAGATASAGEAAAVVNKADVVIPDDNHYKCYPIREHSDFRPRGVILRDQFGETKATVYRPRYLCNPVWKTTDDGQTYSPPRPWSHLVCYEIRESNPTKPWEVLTKDQFGELKLLGDYAELLCLPAYKEIIIPPGG